VTLAGWKRKETGIILASKTGKRLLLFLSVGAFKVVQQCTIYHVEIEFTADCQSACWLEKKGDTYNISQQDKEEITSLLVGRGLQSATVRQNCGL
jgi:hypothetical protein